MLGTAMVLTIAAATALAPAAAGAAPPAFVNGGGSASADTVGLKIVVGNANIGYTLGRSVAGYREQAANAEGKAIDLELLPILFGEVAACDGIVPLLPKSSLPPSTSVESAMAGAADSHRAAAYFPGSYGAPSYLLAGYQDAKATAQPLGSGFTENPTQDLGFVQLVAPRTESTAQLSGQVREARAIMTADAMSFLGGMLILVRPKWEALSRSGAVTTTEGSFSFESATLFGFPRSKEQALVDLQNVGGLLSNLLGGLGVSMMLPEVKIEDKRVKVTPLTFQIANIPLGKLAIGPIFDAFRTQIDTYFEDLRASGCEGKQKVTLLMILEGMLAGRGVANIPIGGVSAETDDIYVEPLDLSTGGDDTSTTTEAPAVENNVTNRFSSPNPVGDSYIDLGDGDVVTTDTLPDTGPVVPPTTAPTAEPTGNGTEELAGGGEIDFGESIPVATTSFRDGPSKWTGVLVALVGLMVGAGLILGDRLSIVRGKRVIPE